MAIMGPKKWEPLPSYKTFAGFGLLDYQWSIVDPKKMIQLASGKETVATLVEPRIAALSTDHERQIFTAVLENLEDASLRLTFLNWHQKGKPAGTALPLQGYKTALADLFSRCGGQPRYFVRFGIVLKE